jgi:hypothetical protein
MRSTGKTLSVAALAVTIAVLAFAPAALGQNSSVETYAGGGGNVQSQISSGDPSDPGASATGDPGSLPFTGLDIGLALGGGLVLLVTGALIARFTPRGGRAS